jgi:hypothetical protein
LLPCGVRIGGNRRVAIKIPFTRKSTRLLKIGQGDADIMIIVERFFDQCGQLRIFQFPPPGGNGFCCLKSVNMLLFKYVFVECIDGGAYILCRPNRRSAAGW